MNSVLIPLWPGAELLPHEGVLREAQQSILHPQKNLQVLGQRVPPPLAPCCPFLGATAGCDSLCVWWAGYHTHGKRVRLSRSSGAVMGGDSSQQHQPEHLCAATSRQGRGAGEAQQPSPASCNIWSSPSDQGWCQIVPKASGLLVCFISHTFNLN